MNVTRKAAFVITLLAAVLGVPSAGFSQSEATKTGDLNVEIQVIPIELTQVEPLSFGTIMPFGRAGFVSIQAHDNAVVQSDVHIATPGTRATWSVSGIPNAFFQTILPVEASVSSEAGDTMVVDNFSTAGLASQLDTAGEDDFFVGAVLRVNANQPAGSYSGTYDIMAAYN